MNTPRLTPEQLAEITKALTDKGKIIEAGWIGLKVMSIPETAPQTQLDEMRNSFFAGAQHLFSSILSALDPDTEPTDDDMRRMSLIAKELEEFVSEYIKKHMPQNH